MIAIYFVLSPKSNQNIVVEILVFFYSEISSDKFFKTYILPFSMYNLETV